MLKNTNGQLADKNLLITGGAGRIGAAIAKSVLLEGANVVLADIAEERLQDCVKKLSDVCGENSIHGLTADIRTASGIKNLINEASAKVGPLNSCYLSPLPAAAEGPCNRRRVPASVQL